MDDPLPESHEDRSAFYEDQITALVETWPAEVRQLQRRERAWGVAAIVACVAVIALDHVALRPLVVTVLRPLVVVDVAVLAVTYGYHLANRRALAGLIRVMTDGPSDAPPEREAREAVLQALSRRATAHAGLWSAVVAVAAVVTALATVGLFVDGWLDG